MTSARPLAVVTGASSGIGAATAVQLARAGFDLVLGARRLERLQQVAQLVEAEGAAARVAVLDVTDSASVAAFAEGLDVVDVLVCNAGGALGLERVEQWDEDHWRWMYEANVLGVVRTVTSFLPALRAGTAPRVVVVTSVAGHGVYAGGAGYTTAKHGAAVVVDTLRLEHLQEPIRFIEIVPGMVDTEFSTVRFDGDVERAASVYQGITPLTADDVADAVTWSVTRPAHVTPARIDLMPVHQASGRDVYRQV